MIEWEDRAQNDETHQVFRLSSLQTRANGVGALMLLVGVHYAVKVLKQLHTVNRHGNLGALLEVFLQARKHRRR